MKLYFKPEEYSYIKNILEQAFEAKTANGEQEEVLWDFIRALDDEVEISPGERD